MHPGFRFHPHPILLIQILIVLLAFSSTTTVVQSFSMPSTGPTTQTNTNSDVRAGGGDMRFGKFLIPNSSIFYRTSSSAAFVNLRPIVPGHVLVMPERIVAHLQDLTDDEYDDLWRSVRQVQNLLQAHYSKASAFNVAVQDGRAAGQSVPHVHVHILPRTGGDFERNDDVYDQLEAWAPRECDVMAKQQQHQARESASNNEEHEVSSNAIHVPNDEDRKDRTPEQMADEAAIYRRVLQELVDEEK